VSFRPYDVRAFKGDFLTSRRAVDRVAVRNTGWWSKRMMKLQQMQWSQRGAHLLLQIRTRVLNEEWEETFRRWYRGFRPKTEEQPVRKAA
jgi:hypothetical protein